MMAAARAGRRPPRVAQLAVAQQRVEQRAVAGVVDVAREVLEEPVELVDVAVGDRQDLLAGVNRWRAICSSRICRSPL